MGLCTITRRISVPMLPVVLICLAGCGGQAKVATPSISPSSTTFTTSLTVTISCSDSNTTIYYTIDGSDPTSASTKYTSAVTVASTVTIKARAYDDGDVMQPSDIASATYTKTTSGGETKIYGQVLDSSKDTALKDVQITAGGVAGSATTDSNGRFAISVGVAGTYTVTATLSGYTYAQRSVTVTAGELASVATMYLTPLDSQAISIGPNGGSGSNSDGSIQLSVPAGALSTTTDLRATNFDRGRELPNFLPNASHFTYACELTPDGQTFATPATVRMKNTRNFPAGTQIPVGIYDKTTATWSHETMGTVSADGKWVDYTVSHFSPRDCNLGWTQPPQAGAPDSASVSGDSPRNNHPCSTVGGGSQVGVADGHLSVDHLLPGYRVLGQWRTLVLQYNSHKANADPVLGLRYNINDSNELLPDRMQFIVDVGGQRIVRYFIPYNGAMTFLYKWDGKDGLGNALAAGSYSYKLTLINEYDINFATAAQFGGAALVDTGVSADEPASYASTFTGTVAIGQTSTAPFGSGWGIVGHHQLTQADSKVTITGGDGTTHTFTKDSAGTYTAGSGDLSTLTANTDGTFSWVRDALTTTFSAAGLQTTIVDRNGNTTTFTYDQNNRLTKITDPMSNATTLAYDSNGRLASITDPAGRKTESQIDANGNLVKITNPDSSTRTFAYDTSHRMTSQTDAGSAKTTYTFNSLGAVTRVDRPDGSHTEYSTGAAYVSINDLAAGPGTETSPASLAGAGAPSYTDGAGGKYTFQVNRFGTRTSITDPIGRTVSMGRDTNDEITTLTMPSGKIVVNQYNTKGLLTQSVGTTTVDVTYHSTLDLPTVITDDTIGTWQFTYNTKGNVTQEQLPDGTSRTITYNSHGQPLSVTVAGRTTTYGYNTDGNIASITAPGYVKWTFTYDAYGNLASVTDPNSVTTTATYNVMNLMTKVTNGAGDTTTFTYAPARGSLDLTGEGPVAVLTKVTDGRANATTFTFDSMYRISTLTDALGNQTAFAYDGAGRMTSRTEPTGATVTLTYNAAGELTGKTLSTGETDAYVYNTTSGLLTSATSSANKLEFTYDTDDRLSQVTSTFLPSNFKADLQYAYRASNYFESLGTLTVGSDSLHYGVDFDATSGHLPASIFGDGLWWLYPTYDTAGRMTGWQETGNWLTAAFTYDNTNHLTATTYTDWNPATVFSASWAYSSGGRIIKTTDPDGQHTFSYDNAGRLTQATHPTGDNPTESYTYDAAGNRRVSGKESSFTHDAANRLTADDAYTYQYDASGNLTRKTHTASSAVTTYTYNAENQLTKVVLPGGPTVQFVYDAFGRRIEKHVGTQITRYVYDGDEELAEFDQTNTLIRSYVNGLEIDNPGGTLIGSFASYQEYYYYTDPLGTVLAVAKNQGGQVATSYRYQAFGQPVAATGSVTNPRLFAGRDYDTNTGLYYLRNRFYDPTTGRFLQRDPVLPRWAIAPYTYADNDPVNTRDPYGLDPPSQLDGFGDFVNEQVVTPTVNDAIGRSMEAVPQAAELVSEYSTGRFAKGAAAVGAVTDALDLGGKAGAAWGAYLQTKDLTDILRAKCPTAAAIKWYKSQWWNPAAKYTDSVITIGGTFTHTETRSRPRKARAPFDGPRVHGLRR